MDQARKSTVKALLCLSLMVAASAQAQQFGDSGQKPGVVMQDVVVDPGRESSVKEVSPGVLQFDFGKPPVIVQKPVRTSDSGAQGAALQPAQSGQSAQTDPQQTSAPSEWRVGIYGGARQSQQEAVQTPYLQMMVPLGRAGATVAAPLVKAAAAVSAANSVAAPTAAQCDVPVAAPAKQVAPKAASAAGSALKDWPQVR